VSRPLTARLVVVIAAMKGDALRTLQRLSVIP